MIKILFVCHGNICRSPMAEAIFKRIVNENNVSDKFEIDSAATSREEIGNGVYPPARRELIKHGITDFTHTARQLTRHDYEYYDKIYVMDENNMYNIMRMTSNDPLNKISKLLNRDVSDPWYSDDFETAYSDIQNGCKKIFTELKELL